MKSDEGRDPHHDPQIGHLSRRLTRGRMSGPRPCGCGGRLSRSKAGAWSRARRSCRRACVRWRCLGLVGVRFHDLRHTGNTMAARSGASTRDLMARMGHDSVRAAIIYQHATTEADVRIAAALDAELASEPAGDDSSGDDDDDGTAGVLVSM